MKQLRLALIIAALAGAPVTGTIAQTPAPPAATRTAGTYMEALGRQIGITPQQKPAWTRYADTVTSVSHQMQNDHQTTMGAMDTASWPERCGMMNRMFETRQDTSAAVHKAATSLWHDLSATQKQKAKTILPGLALPPAPGFG